MTTEPIAPHSQPPRSHLMMIRFDTAVFVVDIQTKLIPHIADHQHLIWNAGRIIDGAAVLDIPVFVTEQYPKGLGHTHLDLMAKLENAPVFEKTMFSCRECHDLLKQLSENIKNVLLVGVETHVCVLQSALDLMALGYDVFVCIDAVGSRFEEDDMTAMQRLETAGAVLVTTEMALFEWCENSGTDQFKKISNIVQEEFVELDDED